MEIRRTLIECLAYVVPISAKTHSIQCWFPTLLDIKNYLGSQSIEIKSKHFPNRTSNQKFDSEYSKTQKSRLTTSMLE